ncbi:hypothetical protein BH24BAC1_BH24BAC1_23610 [soil metagenome]
MKMHPFYETMTKVWDEVVELNRTHKLVNVFPDRVEGIN